MIFIHSTNPAYDSKFFATKPLFNKILIANRGEIAIRVMRTAKRLGVKTVAVFSEADCDAQFVKMADEAYCIGPAASAESYLRMDKIIDVAKKSGAQAIHPGYGFLSENASFADLVAKSGLSFIGPPAQAIIDMGSKSASKEIMTNAGVPCVPGYHGANQDPNFLKNEADKMGYPVLIKAVKGGGGKGMRIVEREDEFFDMLESSRREATKSFGDDTVLVEKYIVRPRHVEVQVFADTHGNAVYLFERDCSVQRRHQKVLEEAPAPHLSPELRANLGAKAVAAAKAVNYVGAGTVEFIFDTTTSQFYFMEMNTRLQVEHPITEMITNTDLVEWQLIVAAGNKVPRLQKDLAIDGWAFEARIYAENPENNFMPDTGPLRHLSFPAASESVRIETGVQQGDTVSVHYDPMISKLVVKGSDRTEALRVLRKALGEFEVVGLNTNIEFLKKLASHPEFINGDVETGFIKKYYDDLFSPIPPASDTTLAHATLSLFSSSLPAQSTDPWDFVGLTGFRMNSTVGSTKTYQFVDSAGRPSAKTQVAAARDASGMYEVTVETSASTAAPTVFKNVRVLSHNQADGGMIIADIGDKRVKGRVVREGDEKIHVFSDGTKVTLHLAPDAAHVGAGIANTATGSVKTPMPCKISSVHVEAGAIVKKGQNLVVLEAMKMEHVIKSPKDGVVKRVHYKVGEIVGEGKRMKSRLPIPTGRIKNCNADIDRRNQHGVGYSAPHIILQKTAEYDIMISYCWAQKDRVERLATFLRQYFTVWIDNERMIGDINESMASAIRSSKVIIACLSREYYGSRNCKHEIMFADKQAKAIVWLHFDNAKCPDWCEIIANKDLYYTVTSLADLQSKLPKIQEAIENLIGHSSAAKTPTVVGIKRADPPRIRSRLPELEKLGLRPVRVDEIIEEKRVALLKGTRKQLLDEITVWCANTNSKCIFWLKGVAGSGKSVIAANVMEMLRVSNKKACAFFCKHSVQDQSDPRKLIQTIAYQLAQLIPSAQQMIQEEIEENEHLLGSSLLLLATKLIIQPLQQYHDSQIFIVVDALDECRNRAEVAKIFNLIVDSFVSTKIKLFFTSRPEQDISREIPAEGREIILSENYNLEDVLLYSHNRMAKLVKSLSTLSEFPTHKNLALRMAENAAGLFIWIKLAYDELEDVDDVEEAILNLLKVKGINELYTQIFKSACDGLDNVRLATASKVIGFIAAVKYPLSSNTLAALLGMKPASVQFYVARFRSIFVTNPNGTIKFMHKSVEDYIADPSQNTVLSISLTEIENEITRLCFTIRSNINWKPLNTGKKIFLSELEVYAFMHISSSSQANTKLSEDVEENGYIPAFYNPEIAQSIVYNPENEIETSLTVRTKGTSSQTITSDYTEFFPRFGTKFQPTNSTLFLQHGLENNIPRVLTGVQDNWISSLKSLRYASDNICSVAVSRNSNYTIPGGGVVVESTNLLSNFTTNDDARASWIVGGNSIANFQENGVLSVASSTDGLHLVSANPFGAVKLWEIFRETLMAMLNDHTGKALSVTFSTDANFITVKLWNASNHELVAKFTIEFNQT